MTFCRTLLVISLILSPLPARAGLWKSLCERIYGEVLPAIPAKAIEVKGPSGASYTTTPMVEKYRGEHMLEAHRVRYFKEQSRKAFEIGVDAEGRLRKADGTLLNTCYPATPRCPAALFVMGGDGRIYVYAEDFLLENLDEVAHSSLLAGNPVATAGEIFVQDGKLLLVTNKSGHYAPSLASLELAFSELAARGADLAEAKAIDYRGALK